MTIERLFNVTGTPSRPIVMDWSGRTLDGEWNDGTLEVVGCRNVEVIGFDACRSRKNCVLVNECENVTFRSACAWDANPDNNFMPWRITNSKRVNLIDCAGWGSGRKAITFSQGGDDCSLIRFWGRNGTCNWSGPRLTVGIAYNNVRQFLRHCIAWCNDEVTTYRYYGVFSADRVDDGLPVNTLVSECLALGRQQVTAFQPVKVQGIAFRDCLDATGGRTVTPGDMAPLIAAWCESPILGRLRELAGVDVLTDLLSAVRFTEPTPIPVT